jgi:hypothetical protein
MRRTSILRTPTKSKPSTAGSIWKGGARERAQFSPQVETKLSGLCDDAAQYLGKKAFFNLK